ncbi:MAG: PAC2 family protein [archaeon]
MAKEEAKISFIEKTQINFSGYTLIEGFPGMGLVGTIGAKYLSEKLKFEEVGFIDTNIFIPIIRIHDGTPVNPSRIYVHREKKLAIIISEQIIPKYYVEKMAKAIVEWIEENNFARLISLEGISAGEKNQNKIYGIGANEKSLQLLEKFKIQPIKEGITTGITSLILLELKKNKDFEAISILGNANMQADYKAAATIIKKLSEIIGLPVDTEPLMEEAKKTEKELLTHFENLRKTSGKVDKFESHTPMYT